MLILACGTSYYSGCTAKYWLESIAKIPTRSRSPASTATASVPDPKTLVVTISQSRRDRRHAGRAEARAPLGMDAHTLTICNVAPARWCASASWPSSRTPRRDRRGLDQGLHDAAGRAVPADAGAGQGARPSPRPAAGSRPAHLRHLPAAVQAVLALEPQIIAWAEVHAQGERALPGPRPALPDRAGRRALKLKEISYIHAEAYPPANSGTARWRWSTRDAGGHGRAERPLLESSRATCRKCARRRAVRLRRRRHPASRTAGRARDPACRSTTARSARSRTSCRCRCWITPPAPAGRMIHAMRATGEVGDAE